MMNPFLSFAEQSGLVDIEKLIPTILVDLKYSTSDNFTGEVIYPFKQCLLVEEAALNLKEVQEELAAIGLCLKVWDGFRPLNVQWKLWNLVPDERYVSDPRKGGHHTRGTAVDVTLVTLDGKELPMPSGFDDFSERAHRDFQDCLSELKENSQLLEDVMERHGFKGLPTEWWHFDLVGWESYPPLDYDVELAAK